MSETSTIHWEISQFESVLQQIETFNTGGWLRVLALIKIDPRMLTKNDAQVFWV